MRRFSFLSPVNLLFTFTVVLLLISSQNTFLVRAIETNPNPAFVPTSSIPTTKGTAAPSARSKMFAFPINKQEDISAFAGKISPVLSKLYITPVKAKNILNALKTVTERGDLVFIIFVGWPLLPLVKFPYEKLSLGAGFNRSKAKEEDSSKQLKLADKRAFVDTKVYFYTHLIAEAGRIAALVYFIDCLAIALETLGFNVQHHSKYFAKMIYTAWIFLRINALRNFFIAKAFRYNGPDEKKRRRTYVRAKVTNRVLDIASWGVFIISLLDVLKIEAGIFLSSFFAVGGAGTLVLSFASKDAAMHLVSGLLLQASDKVCEGDTVKFGNAIQGVVIKVGVLESLVKHDGEMLTAVPNKELANQRLTNLSRIKFAQVSQTLRFDYKDASTIPKIIDEIRNEIRASCPHVVTDGSRPFRIFWSSYGESCLEVMVDVRMSIPPIGDRFFEGRQEVLMAINRALDRLGVQLVVLEDGRKIK